MTTDEWRGGGATYRHRGQAIFYRTGGAGATVVCLHGFPTASWDWHRMWPALTARFRVVVFDLIGYGFSAKPTRYPYSTFDQADLFEGLLKFLGIGQAHILAHDYGDTVAQELLARRLERPEEGATLQSVCLLNGGLFYEAIQPRPVQRLLLTPLGPLIGRLYNRRSFGRTFRALFGPRTQPTEADLDEFWRLVSGNGGRKIIHRLIRYLPERARYRQRWGDALIQSPVPLRFINGPEDPVSGRRMAERYRELVPNADVVLLEGVGHYPQVEAPDAVLREFIRFVGRYS